MVTSHQISHHTKLQFPFALELPTEIDATPYVWTFVSTVFLVGDHLLSVIEITTYNHLRERASILRGNHR